jgi:hypothetical protein
MIKNIFVLGELQENQFFYFFIKRLHWTNFQKWGNLVEVVIILLILFYY